MIESPIENFRIITHKDEMKGHPFFGHMYTYSYAELAGLLVHASEKNKTMLYGLFSSKLNHFYWGLLTLISDDKLYDCKDYNVYDQFSTNFSNCVLRYTNQCANTDAKKIMEPFQEIHRPVVTNLTTSFEKICLHEKHENNFGMVSRVLFVYLLSFQKTIADLKETIIKLGLNDRRKS
jgi:hypothetical protein